MTYSTIKRRTPLPRSTKPLKRGGPIRKQSAKARRLQREWNKITARVNERNGGACMAKYPGCTGIAEHGHHIRQKGREGKWINTEENCLPVCWSCHDRIHNGGRDDRGRIETAEGRD